MGNFTVYIILCCDDSYYTGITNDLERRWTEHNGDSKEFSYTQCRKPLQIVFTRDFTYPDQAIAFEKQIKGWSRKKKQALIDSNWLELHRLAVCLNETSHNRPQRQNLNADKV